jgi:peptidoglycan-associated lipoprotein
MNKALFQTAVVSSLVLLLSACTTTPIKDEDAVTNPVIDDEDTMAENTENSTQTGIDDPKNINGSEINNPVCFPDCVYRKDAIFEISSQLAQKIIYFNFDQSKIKEEFIDVIEQHSVYLTEFPDAKIRLEGHSDERGSKEYNVALGDKRSNVVKRYLQIKGVNASQISTVSFGEELPARLGHNKESWALNRRVEIVYE